MQNKHNQALSALKINFVRQPYRAYHDELLFYVVRKAADRLSDSRCHHEKKARNGLFLYIKIFIALSKNISSK